jgi:hypothetical protein
MKSVDVKRVVGMLVDEQFSIEDIFQLLTDEKELNERIVEAEEVMAEEQEENKE